jgi:hypothetical protein
MKPTAATINHTAGTTPASFLNVSPKTNTTMNAKAYILAKAIHSLSIKYKGLTTGAILVYNIKTGQLQEVSESAISDDHIVLKGAGVTNGLQEIYNQVEYKLFTDDKASI